jgi:hypothetical protein
MSFSLIKDGFEIHRGVCKGALLEALRDEAESVAALAGSACVRHLRSRSALFRELAIADSVYAFLPRDVKPVRSILFDKTSTENWPVAWHQDLTICVAEENVIDGYGPWSHKDGVPHVQPPIELLRNMITYRLHLDDTPESNGALRVIPGSHEWGRISAESLAELDKESAVTCECNAGDVVLMSPLLLHSSRRSVAPARRRVIHYEYARIDDLHPRLHWFEGADAG